MKKIFTLMLAVFMIFCLVGCGEKAGNGGNVEETKKEEQKVLGIGESGKAEEFEVSIVKVSKPTEWKFPPKEGTEYIAVEIQAKNISSEEASIAQGDFQYMGSDGYMHGRYADTYSGFGVTPNTFGAEKVKPGETFNGTIVYDMPKDMETVEMWYRESYTTTPDVLFKFSK